MVLRSGGRRLDPEVRAQLDAHLAGCADCRRELERFEETVSLLRAVESPRAPVGFVDRVLDTARPLPWYRRLGERLARLRPLRLPVEAAAVVLVATLAVYVFQETPELRQAARPESTATLTLERPERDALSQTTRASGDASPEPTTKSRALQDVPAPNPALPRAPGELSPLKKEDRAPTGTVLVPTMADPAPGKPGASEPAAPESTLSRPGEASIGLRQEPAAGQSRTPPSGPSTPAPAVQSSLPPTSPSTAAPAAQSTGPLSDPKQTESPAAPPAAAAPPAVPGSGSPSSERRDKARDQVERLSQTPAPPPALSAMRSRPSPTVGGRLKVTDRQRADRDLAELLSRLGGTETARRPEADAVVVDVIVPRTAYAAFAHGLARIGAWSPDPEPSELPAHVPITLRIGL